MDVTSGDGASKTSNKDHSKSEPPSKLSDPALLGSVEPSPSFFENNFVSVRQCSVGLQRCLSNLRELPSSRLTAFCIDAIARLDNSLCQRLGQVSSEIEQDTRPRPRTHNPLDFEVLPPDWKMLERPKDNPQQTEQSDSDSEQFSPASTSDSQPRLQSLRPSSGGIIIPYTIPDDSDDVSSDTTLVSGSPRSMNCDKDYFDIVPSHGEVEVGPSTTLSKDVAMTDDARNKSGECGDADSAIDIMTPADRSSGYFSLRSYSQSDDLQTVSLKDIEDHDAPTSGPILPDISLNYELTDFDEQPTDLDFLFDGFFEQQPQESGFLFG